MYARDHHDREPLIMLSAISILWLKPQNPDAQRLIEAYHQKGYSREMLYEVALQLFLIAGFQASLEAVFQLEAVLGPHQPTDRRPVPDCHPDQLMPAGLQLQARVYRDNVDKLRENLSRVSPELADWTVMIGYGLVLSRPGLPESWRELLEVAVLSASQFPRQLHSHLRGALNLGATAEEVEIVLHVNQLLSSAESSQSAWQMWRHIRR
jgi:4-carboxymuconolactone decarboxylase